MQLEFAECIRLALNDLGQPQTAIEVEECPAYYGAVLTSPVLFSLTREPQDLSRRFVAAISNPDFAGRGLFEIQIGGDGHLNANPTLEFRRRFLATLTERGPEILVNSQTFVLPSEAKAEIEPEKNWRRIAAALKSTAPEDHELLAARDAEFIRGDTRMMALGLLADREISVEPFLNDVGSRENLPWLFRRFADDMSELLKKSDQLNEEMLEGILAEPHLTRLCDGVLNFRGELAKAARLRRPEILLEHLLGLLRTIYTQYNCPKFRSFILSAEGAGARGLFLLLRQVLGLGLSRMFAVEELRSMQLATRYR